MFEKLEEMIKRENTNVIRYAMYRDGEILTRERVKSYPCSNCYSLSKNFTATAIGLAYDRGLLDVEDPILRYFEKEAPENADPRLPDVQIRHLLTQTMGLGEGSLFERDRYTHGTDDFVRFALSASLPYAPGEKFTYSNSTYYLLSCIVEKVSKMPMDKFLLANLFTPLGITDYAWESCPKGHTMGATGLYLSTADLLKFGILYLDRGLWQGRRVLSEKWVHMATNPVPGIAEISTAFSFRFYPDGRFRGSGAFGQFLMVIPSRKTVFAAHSFDNGTKAVELFEEYLRDPD